MDALDLNGLNTSRSSMSGRRRTPRPNSSRPQSAAEKRPPWKGSDTTPQDIWRNNYLDNDDSKAKVNQM